MKGFTAIVLLAALLTASSSKCQIMGDTLNPTGWDACLSLFSWVAETGPMMGNNSFDDREKAQLLRMPSFGNGFVTRAVVYWDFVRIGGNGRVKVKAYSVGADGKPLNLLTVSDSFRISELDTLSGRTVFSFAVPAAFSNEVFLSLDLRALEAGDTVSILGTAEECASVCGAYELWNVGIWNKICDTYNLNKVDMAIRGVVDWTPTGLEQLSQTTGAVYPNPSYGLIHLCQPNPEMDFWQILDVNGRLRKEGYMEPDLVLDVSVLEPGMYLLRGLKADGTSSAGIPFQKR